MKRNKNETNNKKIISAKFKNTKFKKFILRIVLDIKELVISLVLDMKKLNKI